MGGGMPPMGGMGGGMPPMGMPGMGFWKKKYKKWFL